MGAQGNSGAMSRPEKPKVPAGRPGLPAEMLRTEQRLAARALRQWRASGGKELPALAAQGLLVEDPAGRCEIVTLGERIADSFGLVPGQRLALTPGLDGLGLEVRAACDLVALGGQPVPFEASVQAGGLVLVRGIALPVPGDRVQVVMSWREVLNRSAAARLKQELGRALAQRSRPERPRLDALPLGRLDQR